MIDTNTKHAILKAHIEAFNARNVGCFEVVTDPAHWDNKIYQIDTPEKFDLYIDRQALYEAIKDIRGYKPDYGQLKKMTALQLRAALDEIYAEAKK